MFSRSLVLTATSFHDVATQTLILSVVSVSISAFQFFIPRSIVAQKSGMAYLSAYIAAADHARQQKKRLFWLRPKFHAFTHAVLSCHRPSRRSVHMDACWMDEDFVGKLMDVMATASNYSTSSQKVCERWLVGLPDRMAHSASQSHS